jgi:hypothetical protein
MVMACVKCVMIEAGVSINSWSEPRAGYWANGDILQFVYKALPSTAPVATNTNITVAAGHLTFWDVVSQFASNLITNMKAGLIGDGILLTEFQYIPTGGKLIKVDLLDSKVNFYIKSSLKMQNRSVAALGDDEIDVNNVPIYGKMYNGVGNGAHQRTVDSVNFINGPNLSTSCLVDGSSFTNFSEPPDASEFTHVKRFGKVYINPGHVKYSNLKFRSTILINNLFMRLLDYYLSNATQQWFSIGGFNMFALERVIGKLPLEYSPAINVTFEIDFKGFMTLFPSPQKFTSPMRQVT